ncbi:MAG: hypothetical protein V5A88_00550 [Candidatus Thermoplasmatota archaeon]
MEGGSCFIYLLVIGLMIILSVLLSRRSEEASKHIFYYTIGLGALGGIIGIIIVEVFRNQGNAPIGVYAFVVLAGIILNTFATWLLAGFPAK